ncbi:MAG: uroporphyrinogen-III C-methyltransferase [Steroidobacteraceae bacterium]|nr:uroporphyrinogen-III C-methyltransferase [Steroidobacteraceae bacterium]
MRYFPLFLDIAGKPVLLVGGGEVAARKFALLSGAGAVVTVVAPGLSGEMADAVARGACTHIAREFVASDLEDKWLAVAATNDRAVNSRVSQVATAARIPCNVVDDRELSSFIMPAIIDRSPVQIAISTGGTSPVLARLIRERLETLLDGSLGTLAAFADRWRVAVKQKFADIGARRRFLSWMLTGPVAAALRAGREAQAETLTRKALETEDALPQGHVVLVGAGPGNAGLMTLLGLRALQEADVIVHDRLVSPEVLELARRDAARFDVGKFVGGGGATQEEINKLLVEHAQRGEYVVRLKGGDPFVFGRGGEEIDCLREHGVSFEVIPGITAALAAGAYAGIPLTDRRHSQAVRFLTGNSDEQLAQYSYADLAAGRETLTFYMSVGRLTGLRTRLLDCGVAADMPVAFVENASRINQRVIATTVDAMQRDAIAHHVKAPTLMIIGNVAKYAAELQWFGRQAVASASA